MCVYHIRKRTHTFIPAGIPPVAKETTWSAVKSGFLKISTSKSSPQGKHLITWGARSTIFSYFTLSSLFTIAVKPTIWRVISGLTEWDHLYGSDTFPFGTSPIRVNIFLHESYVALDHRCRVLDPESGTLFVCIDRPSLETEGADQSRWSVERENHPNGLKWYTHDLI